MPNLITSYLCMTFAWEALALSSVEMAEAWMQRVVRGL